MIKGELILMAMEGKEEGMVELTFQSTGQPRALQTPLDSYWENAKLTIQLPLEAALKYQFAEVVEFRIRQKDD